MATIAPSQYTGVAALALAGTDADRPAVGGFAVTKSDATVFGVAANTFKTRGLYVGGAGDVAVRFVDGNTATLVGVAAGSLLPVSVDKVLSTGTSATSIVALY